VRIDTLDLGDTQPQQLGLTGSVLCAVGERGELSHDGLPSGPCLPVLGQDETVRVAREGVKRLALS
jgi:hypothetical protein